MSKIKKYLKRSIRWILKGVPEEKVYVNVLSRETGKLFEGKNILITGGSSGIGLEIAKKAIREGCETICITGRDENKLSETGNMLGEKCKCIVYDMGDISNSEEKFRKCIEALDNKIDIIVSNAGVYFEKDFVDYTSSDYDKMLDINLKGAYFLSQYAIKYFLANKVRGSILFVSSERGIMSDTHLYGIGKAGLNSLVKGLAKSYSMYGIRVNAIAPGMTATGINGIDPMSDLAHKNICHRVLRPEEIAEVAVFLMGDSANCINGEIISCNGGNAIK